MTKPLRRKLGQSVDRLDPGTAFFDDAYHRLIAPLYSAVETRREVAAIREMLALAQDDVILDLGCGWGRHLRLLQEIGHHVIGIDRSYPLLGRARDTRAVEDVAPGPRVAQPPALVAGDIRWLPFGEGNFDAIFNVATSLGLFLDDRDVVAALSEARRVLGPGGRLLMEGMHRDDVVATYAERDRWTMADGTEVRARRRFDARRGVSHEVLRWRGPTGSGTKRHSLRLRTATEMLALLEEAGFGHTDAYGGWGMERFGREADRLILIAR